MPGSSSTESTQPTSVEIQDASPPIRRSIGQRLRSGVVRSTKIVLGLLLLYALAVGAGLISVNNDFVVATEPDGVRIFVESSDVHADFILPMKTDHFDWSETPLFEELRAVHRNAKLDHIAVGWGDRGFYLQTPTWNDLSLRKVAHAMLLPSRTVMRVALARPRESASCRSVVVSREQYHALTNYIQRTFAQAKNATKKTFAPIRVQPIDVHPAWGKNNFFFEANGSYHVFNTCNCWVGNGLEEAGVRTAWFTPLPKTVFLHWPKESKK